MMKGWGRIECCNVMQDSVTHRCHILTWLVCAVCDGHCWDDYSAVDYKMTVVLAVELMH